MATGAAAVVLAGCIGPSGDTETEPGPAAAEVTVVRGDRTYPLTVKITGWKVGPHPQVPDRGDAVHVTYRTTRTEPLPETMVELAVCAIDSANAVLLCATIAVHEVPGESPVEDTDLWIGPSTDPALSRTARVVVLPDQLRHGLHAGDPKDGDGYVPPDVPAPGERLRIG
ncbi:hypothetical protein ACFPM3_02815 [Streptomyces coeruleoprunus]|uniref:Lipoprotein n=1 Tax=Streptomyces coeruleoprunus TaxID=285563 RepID=A0ABV9XBM4_9ACTN